jgi:membrane protein implicated in regulation of membrane protease activity
MPSNGEIWCLAGFVLLGLELAAPGAFMMWIGLASLGVGLLTLFVAPEFPWQVAAFAAFCALSLALGLSFRRRPNAQTVNTPQSGLVGRTAQCLHFVGAEGRVRLGGTDWPARLTEGASLPASADPLVVVDVAGTVLVVQAQGTTPFEERRGGK